MKLVDKLAVRVYSHRRYCVEVRDLAEPIPDAPTDLCATFRSATPDDISRLTWEDHRYDEGRKAYAIESLQDGNVCLIGECEGEIVHIKWIAFDQVQFPPRSFTLADGWAYFTEAFTVASYKGKGLRKAGLIHALNIAKEHGVARCVNIVYSEERAVQDLHHELGFRWLGDVDRRRILTKWWLEQDPPWLRDFLMDPELEIPLPAI